MSTPDDDKRTELLEQALRLKKVMARSHAPEIPQRPADHPAHLSEMQHSLWLVHQMDRQSAAYNLCDAYQVRGPLDLSELQRGLNEVVARHRILRSTFQARRNTVLQSVNPHTPLAIEVHEVGEGAGRKTAVAEARKPFDLETGPLIRLLSIEERPGNNCLLVLLLHHILADEKALSLLWSELAEAYRGRLSATGPRVQFDDYVHWLEQRDPAAHLEGIAYWRQRLDPLPEELQLHFEKPAGASETARGRILSRTLDSSVQAALRGLAATTGASPFMVFAFVFRLLLQRYTDGQHVAFATPVSTRSHPDTAKMIGYFLNPVVISSLIDEERAVEDAVRDFSREVREVLSHASVPFQKLAEELAPPRHRDRHPIFQVMFVYQEAGHPPQLGDAQLEPMMLDLGAPKFDLTLFVTEGDSSLEIAVEYRSDRFDETWMSHLLDHYETLLEHLPKDLERAAAEVPLLRAWQQSSLGAEAEGPAPKSIPTAPLAQQIIDQSARSPHSPAVICGGIRHSYGEIGLAARSISSELSACDVKRGDRVGLYLDRSSLMISGILGTLWSGAAYVPLDPGYPVARNRDVLEDAEVAAVLTSSKLRDRLPNGPWVTIDVDLLNDAERHAGPPAEISFDSPAYILYTSGSTGRPKGVVVTHDNLRFSTGARFQVYDAAPERFLLVPSVAFDSSVAGIFWTLTAGGTLVIPTDEEARDPRRLAQLAAEERVTTVLCVPSLYDQMLRAGGNDLQGLETVIVAGESCSSRLVQEHFEVLPRVRLFNEYGPTEATVWATVHEITRDDAARPVAIGRPIPGVRVDVLDRLGRRVPTGIPGHAWIAGPTVADGYWRRPDLTTELFQVDPNSTERSYRTGDRMVWTEDGRLLFLGRQDDQIKLRGFRIEPGEIEAALLEHAEVEEAAVVARGVGAGAAIASDAGAAQLVAFVEPKKANTVGGWRQGLAERLPDYMIPSRLVEVPELPRLPNGKIDYRRLRVMALDPEKGAGEDHTVPDTREQALISLWEGLLGRPGIGLNENFFELGGHSLLVVEMTLAIEQDFETSLSAADVFENPTVKELAARIGQRGGPDRPSYQHLFPIQPAGREMPFIIAVPHFFTEMFANRFRGERPVYGLRGVSLRPEGNLGRWRTMQDLGEELVDEISRRFPDETCIMAGYSFGASMAFEAVRVMEERGIPVDRLYLIAPMPFDFFRFGPLRVQIDGLREPVDELPVSEALRRYIKANNPLTLQPYRRVWRWCAIEPWRRLLCGVGRLRKLAGLPLTERILYADVRVDRFRLHAAYRPGTIQTPAVIFNATEPETDAAATWRPHFDGPLTIHDTPDPHLGEATVDDAREVILRHLGDLGAS